MKVCILGVGLTSITLAKTLSNRGIYVDLYFKQKIKDSNKTRTLGISKTNIEFFNKNILNIEKLLWNINKIEVYSDNLKNEKLLNFENENKQLFYIVKNSELNELLIKELNKSKFIKFKKNTNNTNFLKKNYKLIFNCDPNNLISKNLFYKKEIKDYNSQAFTTIIKHKKLLSNNVASQIFTKDGPLAFLPVSKDETSVVYSVKEKKNIDLEDLIKKYNTKYEIIKISEVYNFGLKSSNLRTYHHENIIAFGDLLHKIHPLAGQGFNMSIRDIKIVLKLVNDRLKIGLDLDKSICLDFEKKTKHKNYLFSNGIDFIYEFFNFESKINNNFLSKSVQFFGKKKVVNKFFTKFADNGLVI